MMIRISFTDSEEGWILAEAPELAGCVSQGRTFPEALRNIREAISAWSLAERQKRAFL